MRYAIIVAVDEAGVIGVDGKIPWSVPADLRLFYDITTWPSDRTGRNAVIMGRHTWEGLARKPLRRRLNVVVASQAVEGGEGGRMPRVVGGLREGLDMVRREGCGRVFVIGGQALYEEAIDDPACTAAYVTRISGVHDAPGARRFPVARLEEAFEKVDPEAAGLSVPTPLEGEGYRLEVWRRRRARSSPGRANKNGN